MTDNYWLKRQDHEDEMLAYLVKTLIDFCWDSARKGYCRPDDAEKEVTAAELILTLRRLT